MGRAKKTPFPPWITAKMNGEEARYIRLGNSLLMNPAMLNLSPSAFQIYTYMLLESGGRQQFEFPYSKYGRIMSKPTFQRAKRELVSAGFIEVIRSNQNIRTPSEYRFSESWKLPP